MSSYDGIYGMLSSLIEGETDMITIMANTSALIYSMINRLNWAGFYRVKDGELLLGPFQGKVACMHIPFNKGVCGAAYTSGKTVVVEDVHLFPGHIACDSASLSEIVVPVCSGGKVVAVLDIDSPETGRFGEEEKIFFEKVASLISEKTENRSTRK